MAVPNCKDCAYCSMPSVPVLAQLNLVITSRRDDFSNALCTHPSSPTDPVGGTNKLQCCFHRIKEFGPYCRSTGLWFKKKTT